MKFSVDVKKWLRRGGKHIGKVRYGRLETAEKACIRMSAKGVSGLTPYLCGLCDGYHIGHTPKLFTFEISRGSCISEGAGQNQPNKKG